MADIPNGRGRWGPTTTSEGVGGMQKRGRSDDGDWEYRRRDNDRGYVTHDRNLRRRDDDDSRRSRHDDDYYGRGYSYSKEGGNHANLQWRCVECSASNPNEEQRCVRCGREAATHGKQSAPRSRSRSDSHHKEDNSDLDEFGRKKGKSEKAIRWPPPFESGGASYVFDTRSGMFYEALSDFFYDPKTKLYYGNKQKLYYNYMPEAKPSFRELSLQPGSPSDEDPVNHDASASVADKAEEKPKISICLKTTVLPGGNDNQDDSKVTLRDGKKSKEGQTSPHPSISRTQKQHVVNMEKWSERGKELRGQGDASALTTSASAATNVAKTNKGQPICLLCKRKFASLEKLLQHENLSALHKENLEKKELDDARKAEEAAAAAALAADYRDRAQERRVLHGPESAALPPLPRDYPVDGDGGQEMEVVRPEDNLGDSNIGNQMLQKLGWKAGSFLGRNASEDMPQDESSVGDKGQGNLQSGILKDWERIESLAATGQRSRIAPGPGGGLGSGW